MDFQFGPTLIRLKDQIKGKYHSVNLGMIVWLYNATLASQSMAMYFISMKIFEIQRRHFIHDLSTPEMLML